MNIGLDIWPLVLGLATLVHEWQIIVYDHVDLKYVDTSGDDVGSDQDLLATFTEVVDDRVAFLCVFRAVEGGYLVSFSSHAFGDSVGGVSMLRSAFLGQEGYGLRR